MTRLGSSERSTIRKERGFWAKNSFWLIVILYVFSRVAFLGLGYGSDDDSWLIAKSADNLASNRIYATSRLPGYPLPEFAYASIFATVGRNWWLCNLISAIAGLIALVAFMRSIRILNLPDKWLLAATLAFHSSFWIASTSTHDLVWSVLFLQLSLAVGLSEKPQYAGLFAGLAMGARLSNGVMIIPLFLILWWKKKPIRDFVLCSGFFLLAGGLALAPLWFVYGYSFLQYSPPTSRDYITGAYKVYAGIIGFPFVVLMGAYFLWVLKKKYKSRKAVEIHRTRREPDWIVLVSATFLLSLPFLFLPIDPHYLLPAVPFLVLLLGLVRSVFFRRALLLGLMLNSLVGMARFDIQAWREHHRLQFVPLAQGSFLEDVQYRRSMLTKADGLVRTSFPRPSSTIVGSGYYPLLKRLGIPESGFDDFITTQQGQIKLFRFMTEAQLQQEYRRAPIYYVDGENLPYLMRRIYGYSLDSVQAKPLILPEGK